MDDRPTSPTQPPDTPLEQLRSRFGPHGWDIKAQPSDLHVWIAIRRDGNSERVVASHLPGELWHKLEVIEQEESQS
jgi:hypothetical protein